jgi:hypothetical protein
VPSSSLRDSAVETSRLLRDVGWAMRTIVRYKGFTLVATLPLVLAASGSFGAQAPRVESGSPPYVVVQAVDAMWVPVPGAEVLLEEKSRTRLTHKAVTNAEGFASFRLDPPDPQQSFTVSVSMAGFKKGEMKDVRFGTCDGDCKYSRYVQLRLAVSGPKYTIQ